MHHLRVVAAVVFTFAAGILGSCSPAEAPEPAAVAEHTSALAAAAMANARGVMTLTRLTDGRVLVAGGFNGSSTLRASELYDPATGTWSATGSLVVGRSAHTVSTLTDGRVLIAGGIISTVTGAAELYDPSSGTWSVVAPLSVARYQHAAQVLDDGRVMVAGGTSTGGVRPREVELFDPATQTWSLAAPAPGPISRLAKLSTGQVLAAEANNAFLYSPASGSWSTVGPLPSGVYAYYVVPLPGGRALVVGAQSGSVSAAAIFDAATGTFVTTAPMPMNSWDGVAEPMPDGTLLFFGGSTSSGPHARVVRYWPASSTWTTEASLEVSRTTPGAVRLSADTYLVAGGRNTLSGSWTSLSSAELYVLSPCAPSSCADRGAACGAISDGCGATVECGSCGEGTACEANQCVCVPTTCAAQGAACGQLGDSCGGVLDCGGCAAGEGCVANQCVCVPTSCGAQGATCGALPDGCGGTLDCGGCAAGETCALNQCVCQPKTCAELGAICGSIPDGCGGTLTCGTCGAGLTCENNKVCADHTKPTVSFIQPANGARVSGTLTVSASASDNVAVSSVWLYVGNTMVANLSAPPYQYALNTRNYPVGSTQQLWAVATDTSGNQQSANVSVVIANDTVPPTVSITAPVAGAALSGTTTLAANASDDVGVARVDFYVDGTFVGSDSVAPYSLSWSSASVPNGLHTAYVYAFDAAGNSSNVNVTFTVSNGSTGGGSGSAAYDSTFKAPRCTAPGASCDTGTLVNGRANLGPEPSQPNTLFGSCADGSSGAYHSDESLDRLVLRTVDGSSLAAGKAVVVEATVWSWGTSDRLDVYYAVDAANPVWQWKGTVNAPGSGKLLMTVQFGLTAGAKNQAIRGVFRYGGSASPCAAGSFDDRDDLVFALP